MSQDKSTELESMTEEERALHARREVLKRMGIYTAVSAPILLGALKADRAVAATGGGIPGGGGTGSGGSGGFGVI